MAEIQMSYIFFNKEKCLNKYIKDIILERIDSIAISRNGNSVEMQYKYKSYYIEYKIIQKSSDENCYLMLKSTDRVNVSMQLLGQIDDAISKTTERKYYYVIKNYDGMSKEYCEKLYPKFACFERKLREVVFILLTKAYGGNWYEKTKIPDIHEAVAQKARGDESLISEALEHMDYAMLEKYLFEKRIPNYEEIVDNSLSYDNLNKMSKEEICTIIERMRRRSLWESHFSSIGSGEIWEKDIKQIHNTRNKVAHNKTVTKKEYEIASKNLGRINKNLQKVVTKLQDENFTEVRSADILGNFALFVANNIRETNVYKDLVESFSIRVKELIEPIKEIYTSNMVKMLSKELEYVRKLYATPGMIESLDTTAKMMKAITPSIPTVMSAQQQALSVYKNMGLLNQNTDRKSEEDDDEANNVKV